MFGSLVEFGSGVGWLPDALPFFGERGYGSSCLGCCFMFSFFLFWKEDEIKVFFVVDVLSNYLLVLIIYLYILCLWEGYIWRAKLWCVDGGLFNIGISFLKIRIIGLIIPSLLGVYLNEYSC